MVTGTVSELWSAKAASTVLSLNSSLFWMVTCCDGSKGGSWSTCRPVTVRRMRWWQSQDRVCTSILWPVQLSLKRGGTENLSWNVQKEGRFRINVYLGNGSGSYLTKNSFYQDASTRLVHSTCFLYSQSQLRAWIATLDPLWWTDWLKSWTLHLTTSKTWFLNWNCSLNC